MKINRLILKNWRNHEDSTLDISGDKLTILVGLSRAGKSSIPAAIEQALTGRCEWTGERGEGAEHLVRSDSGGKAVITLELADSPVITRSVPNALQVGTEKGGLEAQQAALYEGLGHGREQIRQAINVRRFLALPQKEQQEVLFQALGIRFDARSLLEALGTWDKELPALGTFFREHLQRLGKQSAYDYCYNQRRDAKKDRDSAKKALDAIPAGGPQTEVHAVTKAHGALSITLATKRDDLAEVKTRNRLAGEIDAQIAAAKQNLGALTQERKSLPAVKAKKAKDDPSARIEELRGLISSAGAVTSSLAAERAAAQNTLRAIKTAAGKCPLSDRIPCAADLTSIQAGLEADVSRIDAALNDHDKQVKSLTDELNTLLGQRVKSQEEEKAREAAVKRLDEADQRLAALQARVKDLEAQRAGIAVVDVTDLQAEVARLEAEEVQLRTRMIDADRAAKDKLRRKAATEQVACLEATVRNWEALVKAFDSSGIKARILGEKVGPFHEAVSAALASVVPGASVEVVVEPYGVWVTLPGRGRLPASVLSTSEQDLVGAVIQAVLAEDLGFLVVDKLEHLDPALRSAFYRFLLKRPKLRTVLVLMVLAAKEVPEPPAIPGVGLWLVESGTITRVGREQEAANV